MSEDDLRKQMEREATEFVERRRLASMATGTRHGGIMPKKYSKIREAENLRATNKAETTIRILESRLPARDPCFNCGVRRDRHADFGCKTWRGESA